MQCGGRLDREISAGDRLLVGVADECSGYEDIVFDFGRDFASPNQQKNDKFCRRRWGRGVV